MRRPKGHPDSALRAALKLRSDTHALSTSTQRDIFPFQPQPRGGWTDDHVNLRRLPARREGGLISQSVWVHLLARKNKR